VFLLSPMTIHPAVRRTYARGVATLSSVYLGLRSLWLGPTAVITSYLLIYPNRLDVQLILDFLREYDGNGHSELNSTPYFQYLVQRENQNRGAAEKAVQRLLKVYIRIRSYRNNQYGGGWRYFRSWRKQNWVTVVRINNPHEIVSIDGKSRPAWVVLRPWELGSDVTLLAILTHLGEERIRCRVKSSEPHSLPHDISGEIISQSYGKAYLKHPGWPVLLEDRNRLASLNMTLAGLFVDQKHSHGHGLMYQGFRKLGIPGWRLVEDRFEEYGFKAFLTKDSVVLDIGCNCGFFALYVAQFAAHVDALDIDGSQIATGKAVQKYLGIENCDLFQSTFEQFIPTRTYDLICSFAVHRWIGLELRDYFERLYKMLSGGGFVVFESHFLHEIDKNLHGRLPEAIRDLFRIEQESVTHENRMILILKRIGSPALRDWAGASASSGRKVNDSGSMARKIQ